MNASITNIDFAERLAQVRSARPLVHNITNTVVTNVVANALLALGASPVMAYAPEEVAEMASMAQALALNMGTLTESLIESMIIAGRAANQASVPVIFDPVGVGATRYRTAMAARVQTELRVNVLRGNQGEIGVLLGGGGAVKGVDSLHGGQELPQLMQAFAARTGTVVVATGEVDYVTDGQHVWALRNGHPLLSAITGSGCQATGVIGAFCGAAPAGAGMTEYAHACIAALTCINIAGERAAALAAGPGTFQAALFDALYHLDGDTLARQANVRVLEV